MAVWLPQLCKGSWGAAGTEVMSQPAQCAGVQGYVHNALHTACWVVPGCRAICVTPRDLCVINAAFPCVCWQQQAAPGRTGLRRPLRCPTSYVTCLTARPARPPATCLQENAEAANAQNAAQAQMRAGRTAQTTALRPMLRVG